VCVAVSPKAADDFGNSERLSLKWSHPVIDVEVICAPADAVLTAVTFYTPHPFVCMYGETVNGNSL
jgi:hypothetical protein